MREFSDQRQILLSVTDTDSRIHLCTACSANHQLRLALHSQRQAGLARNPGETIRRTPRERASPRVSFTDEEGAHHYFARTKGLCLCESAIDVKVNYLLYEQTDKKGRTTRWTWVTDLPLTKRTVEPVMRAGRGRWKIENETFNTLKNQSYHFEHNYGHGEKNLATVLALLMFLAFTVDQMIQRCWQVFRKVRAGLRTKAKLWDSLRSLFTVKFFRTMDALYRHMAELYEIQLC
jgi:hypothetical protein